MKTLKESEAATSEISYYELASKLKAAYRVKAKNQDDMYAEVSVHCYCGGPFEMNITCSGLDDMPNEVAFYVTYLAEDDFGFDVGFGMNNLKTTISDYYKANGDPAEMSPRIAIDPSALRFLDEIAAGQGMLFEKKSKKLREDSLDDFDVDGKIAAANKVAMSDERLQSAIKSIKEQYSDYLYEAVGRLFSSYDLQEVNKEFLKPGEFKCFMSSNMFGGSSRVGSTFYVVFEIGDRYRGALPEHVKLDYNEKRAAVQQFAKELQDEINEIIDEAKAKGFAVHRLQGYGDVFVRDVSQMGSECIEIKISCKITQEEVNSLMESVKTKSKKMSEASISKVKKFGTPYLEKK